MKRLGYIFCMVVVLLLSACEIKIKPNDDGLSRIRVEVQRYDRLESRYLTTGDFSALQQMNIEYPMETRTLIEDVLRLGEVNDPQINSKFLKFYQDTVLQSIIAEAELQYANMSDINQQLQSAFGRMADKFPDIAIPKVYAQIGSLDQSIIVGDNSVGISLDKYLGSDFPLYKKYYNEAQRQMMTREYMVPDCLSFYLLSVFPLKNHDRVSQQTRDTHMAKVLWVVNQLMDKQFFSSPEIAAIGRKMKAKPRLPLSTLFLDEHPTPASASPAKP